MSKKVFNLIILDESGSMCDIEQATVSGLNETIQSIRHAQEKHSEQEHFVSLMSFNSEGRKYHYDCTPTNDIRLFDGKGYQPSGCTPLYDAIGCGIARLRRQVTDDDMVLVTIITDGMENSSCEYSFKTVTALTDNMKSKGWMITYMGANQDAVKVAHDLHIDNGLQYDATTEGVEEMMCVERKSRSDFYERIADFDNPIEMMNTVGCSYFKEDEDNEETEKLIKKKSKR